MSNGDVTFLNSFQFHLHISSLSELVHKIDRTPLEGDRGLHLASCTQHIHNRENGGLHNLMFYWSQRSTPSVVKSPLHDALKGERDKLEALA